MSRSLRKPSVTPRTALATRLRARPWNLPSSGSTRSVDACSSSPFTWNTTPGGSGWRSLPFGPCTSTRPGSTAILTPFGIAIGFLPMRDMSVVPLTSSPHVAEHFTADAGLDRFAAGHHPARRRQDTRAESGEDVRHLVAPEVDAAAGTADPLDPGDHALAARPVLEEHAQARLRLPVRR